jgi:UDP-N-acetylglucosamine 2-epimerase (non-hydrolysing)
VKPCEPLGYLEFLGLMAQAALGLTDSGGIQEERYRLAGVRKSQILNAARQALSTGRSDLVLPPLWDGQATRRIADVIEQVAKPLAKYSLSGCSNTVKLRV